MNEGFSMEPMRTGRPRSWRKASTQAFAERTPQCTLRGLLGQGGRLLGEGHLEQTRPNRCGERLMFLGRVLIGDYCQGKQDSLTHDLRAGFDLYDTTVDSV